MNGGILKWESAGLSVDEAEGGKVQGMSKEEFQELVSEDSLVLVDFYAPWCGPCKKMSPDLKAIQAEYKGKISIIKIDIDKNDLITNELKIDAIPVLQVYKNGQLVNSALGYQTKTKLIGLFQDFL